MAIKVKFGKVIFSSPDSGAFIQPLTLAGPEIKAQMLPSIKSQVFVSPAFFKDKTLEVGQLVRYEVSDDETVAMNVEPVG